MAELLTIKQANKFASDHINKNVTTSNISYLINYGRIKKIGENGTVLIDKQELINYTNHITANVKSNEKIRLSYKWNSPILCKK